jgi:D-alanyl-D-alanine dipeptidase
MPQYKLERGTHIGVRVADDLGNTVTMGGRIFDNMSPRAAEQVMMSLDRLTRLRREHAEGALRRNDLVAILEQSASGYADSYGRMR